MDGQAGLGPDAQRQEGRGHGGPDHGGPDHGGPDLGGSDLGWPGLGRSDLGGPDLSGSDDDGPGPSAPAHDGEGPSAPAHDGQHHDPRAVDTPDDHARHRRRSERRPADDEARGGRYVAVVGPSTCTLVQADVAERLGRALAQRGDVVLCGGGDGVMAAAARGAAQAGGVVVGILPGEDRHAANPWVTIALATGLGELRNGLIVRAADAVVAVGGSWGTLSEVALATRTGVPVVSLDGWAPSVAGGAAAQDGIRGPVEAGTVGEAIALLDRLLAGRRTDATERLRASEG